MAVDLSTYWKNYDPETGVGDPSTPLAAQTLNEWGGHMEQVRADAEALRNQAQDAAEAATAPTDAMIGAVLANPGSAAREVADDLYAAPVGVDSARYVEADTGLDVSADLQAALNAAQVAGAFGAATLTLRPGTYTIASPVTVPAGVTVNGLAGATLEAAGDNRIFDASSDTTFRGLTLRGTLPPGNVATLQSQRGIQAIGTTGARIRNIRVMDCTFEGFHYSAIHLVWVEGFTVSGCTIRDTGYDGVLCSRVWDGQIVGNRIHGTGVLPAYSPNSYGISVSLGSGESELPSRLVVAHNIVTNQAWEAIDTHGGDDLVFANNVIVGCEMGVAVTELTGTSGTGPRNVVVTGNVINAASYPSAAVRAGISINGSADGSRNAVVSVTGNVVTGHGISVEHTARYHETAGAITVRFADSAVVSGNLIRNARNAAIVFRFGRTLAATGNIIQSVWREATGTTGQSTAVYLADHTRATVTGNAFSTGDSGLTHVNERGVHVASGTGAVVEAGNSWAGVWVGGAPAVAGFTNESTVQTQGRFATAVVYLTATSAHAGGANLGAAISGPPHNCPTDIWFTGTSSTGATWRGRVLSTGSVTVNGTPAIASGQVLYGTVTYPVA